MARGEGSGGSEPVHRRICAPVQQGPGSPGGSGGAFDSGRSEQSGPVKGDQRGHYCCGVRWVHWNYCMFRGAVRAAHTERHAPHQRSETGGGVYRRGTAEYRFTVHVRERAGPACGRYPQHCLRAGDLCVGDPAGDDGAWERAFELPASGGVQRRFCGHGRCSGRDQLSAAGVHPADQRQRHSGIRGRRPGVHRGSDSGSGRFRAGGFHPGAGGQDQ